ncbi:MAG: NFACT family protein [Lachnospiraceae bacterium]|nr:NFACT family protein [Lachnospiraceae bacterium]
MAFDGITVCALAEELQQALAGGKINKITQTEGDELYLTVKPQGPEKPVRVVLSASASLPMVYLTEQNKQGPLEAPAFCMLLRKHLQGGRILSVIQPDFERILRFAVEGTDEMGDRRVHTLIIELMGKYSNIILINEENIVVDSIRRVSSSMSSVREVLPGRPYFVPSQDKVIPVDVERIDLQSTIRGKGLPLFKAIYTSYRGLSPIIAQELCHRAGIDADKSAIALSDPEFDRLYEEFHALGSMIRERSFHPVIARIDGEPQEYAACPLTLYERTPGASLHEYGSMSLLIEDYYREKALINRIRERSTDLKHLIATSLERDRKKLSLQEQQLKDTDKRDRYRLYGELLQAYGYQAEPKAKSLTVEDYHTGEPVTIPLDPQLNAQENAKRYFDRYQKLKRTLEALTEQTARVRLDIAHLESMEQALSIARTEADLKDLREELALTGYVGKLKQNDKKNRERKEKSSPLHYRTIDDFGGKGPYDLYVGKNNLQNDYLTFKLANGGDWWFHTKTIHGSHVILRSAGQEPDAIPDHVYELAASLAAYYSQGKAQNLVEVDYVRRKEVKKPAGAHPGYVVYYTNYSMSVRPDLSELTLIND